MLQGFEDVLLSAATNHLVCWNVEKGSQVASITAPSSITAALFLDERMYLATTDRGVWILDGNGNFLRCSFFVDGDSREKRWKLVKLLLLARMKNKWEQGCFISALPLDLIHYLARNMYKFK
jgi:hypothetical protein